MRVLVCGGRDFTDSHLVFTTFQKMGFGPETIIIQGGARGADRLAGVVGTSFHCQIEEYPANWARHGKSAGPIRNQQMLDTGVDLVIAFPGGRGTADMVNRARKAGIRVMEVKSDDKATKVSTPQE